ncbi:hypothetical protein HY386_01520 [Candidatus Daviesbacteria bacterium]|nr:hypothetical protein [Candidatus Daviesbacteria bacterium]
MKKLLLTLTLILILTPGLSLAASYGDQCTKPSDCPSDSVCQPSKADANIFLCSPSLPTPVSVFGKIIPPQAVEDLGIGGTGISQFLSNLVKLIYIVATIVFILMIVWGAFEWLVSGGDKDKVASAQRRLTNAFIGIVLFAVAFAILKVVGTFTGFNFF